MTIKYSEELIERKMKEGYGQGKGADYKPWFSVTDFSSKGRSHRVWSPKTRRTHHFVSDVEHHLFLALEWSHDVIEIREQFPLDRNVTQAIALQLGIRHPCYEKTTIPTVMTVDFMVTRLRDGVEVKEAYDAKRTDEAHEVRSLLKLEIARAMCAKAQIPHHLVFNTMIPSEVIKNINWIRDAPPKEGEVEAYPGFWSGLTERMATALSMDGGTPKKQSLAEYCKHFDAILGMPPGTGLRTARILMSERTLSFDLNEPDAQSLPMSAFRVTGRLGQLKVVGNA